MSDVCEDCQRPKATKEQWNNGHADWPVRMAPNNGFSCECAECIAVCWGEAFYCANVRREREKQPTREERYRAALSRLCDAMAREWPGINWDEYEAARAALKGDA